MPVFDHGHQLVKPRSIIFLFKILLLEFCFTRPLPDQFYKLRKLLLVQASSNFISNPFLGVKLLQRVLLLPPFLSLLMLVESDVASLLFGVWLRLVEL